MDKEMMYKKIMQEINDSILIKKRTSELMHDKIAEAANVICAALISKNKVMFCGNGGSAADAQHLATELVSRFRSERRALAALALTTDTSTLTAISNDYSFSNIFARQVESIGRTGDVLVAISTSGNSKNVLLALKQAREMGIVTIALTGQGGGLMAGIADYLLDIPSSDTPRIQEVHIMVGHIICGLVEEKICG